MSDNRKPAEYPSPLARQVSLTHQILGVGAAPLAWAARMVVNMSVASSACLPADPSPSPQSAPSPITAVLLTSDILALLVAVAAAMIAYRDWQGTRMEKPGAVGQVLEIADGRARFLSLSGIILSLGFAVAVLFDLVTLFIVPVCRR